MGSPMKSLVVGAVIIAAVPLAGRQAAPVSIRATVVTRMGIAIDDLRQDEFEVFDDGRRQTITGFQNSVEPISLVVLIDRSGNPVWNSEVIARAAEDFVTTRLRPGDTARVGSFSSKIVFAPNDFSSDASQLRQAVSTVSQGAGAAQLWNGTAAAIDLLAEIG